MDVRHRASLRETAMKLRRIRTLRTVALATTLIIVAVHTATGTDRPTANPTGTWKVAQMLATGQTLKLKLNGTTLNGTLTYRSSAVVDGKSRMSEAPITEAKLQGSEISFNFTHPPAVGNGPNATYNYRGKISGDSIKGTFTAEWMGHARTRNWEAEILKE
jgi:hypothetical protein